MLVWMREMNCLVAFLCLVGQLSADVPTSSNSSTSSATAATSLMSKIEDKKAQLMSGSKLGSGGSGTSFMDDVAPLKLVQSLVRLNEYGKRQAAELKELQKTRTLMERRVTQMQAQLDTLNKDIPGLASSVQSLAKDPQKSAQWQDATTKMYVAVAQSERLKQLLQRYQGTLKRLDASKLVVKLTTDAQAGKLTDKTTKKSSSSTSKTAANSTPASTTTSGASQASAADDAGTAEPDVMTEVDAPVEDSADTTSTTTTSAPAASTAS